MAALEPSDKGFCAAAFQRFHAAGFQHLGLCAVAPRPHKEVDQIVYRAFGPDHSLNISRLCRLYLWSALAPVFQYAFVDGVGSGRVLGDLLSDLAGRRIDGQAENVRGLERQALQSLADPHDFGLGVNLDMDHVRIASISMVRTPAASSACTTRYSRPSRFRILPDMGRPP